MANTFIQERQSSNVGNIIELFELDVTKSLIRIDELPADFSPIFYFTSANKHSTPIGFKNNTYSNINIDVDGFEWKSQESPPKPKLQISNLSNAIGILAFSLDNFIGAKFTRIVTLAKYCYIETEAGIKYQLLDTTLPFLLENDDDIGMLIPDVFYVSRKTAHNHESLEFELTTVLDQQGKSLPSRIALRNHCTHTYRSFNTQTNSFNDINNDPNNVTCPYIGSTSYDFKDNETTSNKDDCSRSLDSCILRFGKRNPIGLPFAGFPGLTRYRRT